MLPIPVSSYDRREFCRYRPSPRPRDRQDIHLILNTYGPELDWEYLLSIANLLAAALDQPEIGAFLRAHRDSLK